MIASLASQKTAVKTSSYGVNTQPKPKTAGAFLDRGILFVSRGEYESAIADLTEAIRLNPGLSAAYTLREFSQNAIIPAPEMSWIMKGPPNYQFDQAVAAAALERGDFYYHEEEDYDRAIVEYTEAIRLDPRYTDSYRFRGFAYYHKGSYDRAVADFTEALRLKPDYPSGEYYGRAAACYAKGGYDRAIADFNIVLRLDSSNVAARSSLQNAINAKNR